MMHKTQPPSAGPIPALHAGPVMVTAAPPLADEDAMRWANEARHPLKTPDAYEWWYFHAISPTGDGVIFAAFQGLPFRPPHLRSNRRSSASALERRSGIPTDVPAPAAYMAAYQGGKKIAQFLNIYPGDSSLATTAGIGDIRIGPNRITFRHDGSIGIMAKGYPYDITHGHPRHRPDQVLSAQLDYTPSFHVPPHHRPFRAPNANGAMHLWILSAPHGQITGSLRVVDTRENLSLHDVRINTMGYHDHVYGQGSLADGIAKQLWGFLQGETWTAVWHQTIYKHATPHANGLVFFERDRKSVIVEAPESKLDQYQVGRWLSRYPGRIAMHGSDEKGHPIEMLLSHDAMLDGAPFHTGLSAKGTITIPGRGSYTGVGASHSLQLRRLRWPVLSDVTLLAITLVQRDDPLWQQ
jgi:hypothetical protein